jgi:hypothetical protein
MDVKFRFVFALTTELDRLGPFCISKMVLGSLVEGV